MEKGVFMKNVKFLGIIAILVIIAMVLIGCGGRAPRPQEPAGLGGLLDAARALADDPAIEEATRALDAMQGLLDTAAQLQTDVTAQDALRALETAQGLLDTAIQISPDITIQDAQRAADEAAAAIRALGF